MNSVKIEKLSVNELKRVVALHPYMNEFLNDNDKEPSWDGNIVIYTDNDLKVEHIKYTIPTQVKGKNDEKLLKRNSISYSVKYKHLRNYRNSGGVCYFVIVISNDGEKAAIFYNALTPIKLESLLKGTEEKEAEQTKNITLLRLKKNNKNELYRILLQFGHDSREQGTGELVRKAISLDNMQKIDSIRTTSYAFSNQEAMKNVKSGEACLYGHVADADIWLPFSYDIQRKMELVAHVQIDKSFGVDGKIYYNNFEIRQSPGGDIIIRLSDNLSIDIRNNKFSFVIATELLQVMHDLAFFEEMRKGKALYVGERKICEYNNISIEDELLEWEEDIKQIHLATTSFEIELNKRFDDFTEEDWKAIHELVNLYNGKIRPKNRSNAWHMWWWQEKVVPFFIAEENNGNLIIENGTFMKKIIITAQADSGEYRVPAFVNYKRDIWENLYDVEENKLFDELEKGVFCVETEGNYSLLFVEVLAAYDSTQNEKYYKFAVKILDKLLRLSPDNDYWKINRLQLLKRKRELQEEELQELEEMEQRSDDLKVRCATNILLDNKRQAKKELDNMTEEERELFANYPIYNLL